MSPDEAELPPPSFPPGSPHARPQPGESESPATGERDRKDASRESGGDFPENAIIPPDDPIPKREERVPDDAFISPDDPLPGQREDRAGTEGSGRAKPDRLGQRDSIRNDRPTIHELPYLLDQLAERIQASGERALRADPEKGHFEASLCSFLRGYLSGSEE